METIEETIKRIDDIECTFRMKNTQIDQQRKQINRLHSTITDLKKSHRITVARLELKIKHMERMLMETSDEVSDDVPLKVIGVDVDWGEACYCGLTPDDEIENNPYPEHGLYLTLQEFDEEARRRAVVFNRRTADSGYSKVYPTIIFNRGTHASRCDLEFHDMLTFSWKKHALDFLRYELKNPYQETRSDEETAELVEIIKEYEAL